MENRSGFQRAFLIFSNEDSGYEAGQKPSGHIRYEVRDGRGKLRVAVQSLRQDSRIIYKLYLIISETGKTACAGTLPVRNSKAELEWEFNPSNVSSTGYGIDKFDTFAILAEYTDRENRAIICPLASYRGKGTEWRSRVKYELYDSGRKMAVQDDIAQAGPQQPAFQQGVLQQTAFQQTGPQQPAFQQPVFQQPGIHQAGPQPWNVPPWSMQPGRIQPGSTPPENMQQWNNETIPEESVYSKYEFSAESKYIPEENTDLYTEAGISDMPQYQAEAGISDIPRYQIPADDVDLSQYQVPPDAGDVPQHEVLAVAGDMPKYEIPEDTGNVPQYQAQAEAADTPEMPADNGRIGQDQQADSTGAQQSRPSAGPAGINTNCMYLNGNMCGMYIANNDMNPCSSCRVYKQKSTAGSDRQRAGDINRLSAELDVYFESSDPFHSKRSDYKWWKVTNPVNLNNLLYQCGVRSPLLFNPAVMMAHFKYKHLIIGIYTDKTAKKEYVVCGVPGMHMVDRKPFGELCRWVQTEGTKARYGAFGYWLVYVDPVTGRILELK